MPTKLGGGDQLMSHNVMLHALGNGLLHQLAHGFEQGDWVMYLGMGVVRLVWFGYDYYFGLLPTSQTVHEIIIFGVLQQ